MINIKKLIKKMRALIASEKPETIEEYEDDYFCLCNKQIKRALENMPRNPFDDIQYHLNLRRGKPFKMKCEKCGVMSAGWAVFRDEQKTNKIYCLSCYEEHKRSRLNPAVCWFGEAEQIGAIVAKSTHRNDQ